jgi:ribosomal-protein-alanine N-acetyltransferase
MGLLFRNMVMPETLHTARLALRLLGPGNLMAVHMLFSSAGHTIGDGPVRDSAQTAQWLARREMRYREHGLAWYGLWKDETLVGTCGVFLGERCGEEPEIGYEVDSPQRAKGLAREAAGAVTEAAHSAGHARLWATIRPTNTASARVVEVIGYQLVRSRRDAKGELDYWLHCFFND